MSATTEREARQFYAVHEYRVYYVTGYDCRPHNPESWWVPELGYSLQVGYHLFDTREEARLKALEEINSQRAKLLAYERELIGR